MSPAIIGCNLHCELTLLSVNKSSPSFEPLCAVAERLTFRDQKPASRPYLRFALCIKSRRSIESQEPVKRMSVRTFGPASRATGDGSAGFKVALKPWYSVGAAGLLS